MLVARTGVPVLGVVPHFHERLVPAEDSLDLDHLAGGDPAGRGLDIAVVRLPHIANFDDFEPLAAEAGVRVRLAREPGDLDGADLVILPGSKSTMADLAWLRARGLAHAIARSAAGGTAILGICGGYQMLGRRLRDPDRLESRVEESRGLGLLPVETTFTSPKTVVRVDATGVTTSRLFGAATHTFPAYEIHLGRTGSAREPGSTGRSRTVFRIVRREGRPVDAADGAVNPGATVEGTYLHGIFNDAGCGGPSSPGSPGEGESASILAGGHHGRRTVMIGSPTSPAPVSTCRPSRGSPASAIPVGSPGAFGGPEFRGYRDRLGRRHRPCLRRSAEPLSSRGLDGRSPRSGPARRVSRLARGAPGVGGALVVACAALAGLIGWAASSLATASGFIGVVLEAFALKLVISLRDLALSCRDVSRALQAGDIQEARRLVGYHLVSRPTSALDAAQVASAAIESAAENLTDSFVAPLACYLVLRPAGGLRLPDCQHCRLHVRLPRRRSRVLRQDVVLDSTIFST